MIFPLIDDISAEDIIEWFVVAFMIVGIVTAALDVTLGGFTPIIWFALSFGWVLIIICMEVTMIRAFFESKIKG